MGGPCTRHRSGRVHLQTRRDLDREESEHRAQQHEEVGIVVPPDARVEPRAVVVEDLNALVAPPTVLASLVHLLRAVGAPALRRTAGRSALVARIDAHALGRGSHDSGSENRIDYRERDTKRGGPHWRVQAKERCQEQCECNPRDDLVHIQRPLEAVHPPLGRPGVWNSSGGHGCDAAFATRFQVATSQPGGYV